METIHLSPYLLITNYNRLQIIYGWQKVHNTILKMYLKESIECSVDTLHSQQ